MQGNFIMLQMDDLKQVVTEIVEKVCARRRLSEKPSKGDGDWLTREEVCDMLHITYTTLWRKENDGVIQKHKIGRRNLYNKKEVEALLSSGVDIAVTHKKLLCLHRLTPRPLATAFKTGVKMLPLGV